MAQTPEQIKALQDLYQWKNSSLAKAGSLPTGDLSSGVNRGIADVYEQNKQSVLGGMANPVDINALNTDFTSMLDMAKKLTNAKNDSLSSLYQWKNNALAKAGALPTGELSSGINSKIAGANESSMNKINDYYNNIGKSFLNKISPQPQMPQQPQMPSPMMPQQGMAQQMARPTMPQQGMQTTQQQQMNPFKQWVQQNKIGKPQTREQGQQIYNLWKQVYGGK